LIQEHGTHSWEVVAMQMGNGRTAYQCMYRWRNRISPPEKMNWADVDKDDKNQEGSRNKIDKNKTDVVVVKDPILTDAIFKHEGNWKKSAADCGDHLATKKQIIDR